jgi:hypothetical protein
VFWPGVFGILADSERSRRVEMLPMITRVTPWTVEPKVLTWEVHALPLIRDAVHTPAASAIARAHSRLDLLAIRGEVERQHQQPSRVDEGEHQHQQHAARSMPADPAAIRRAISRPSKVAATCAMVRRTTLRSAS